MMIPKKAFHKPHHVTHGGRSPALPERPSRSPLNDEGAESKLGLGSDGDAVT